MQAVCENSSQPVVVQQIDSGSAAFSIRQQEFTALAPAYLGNIPVSVQQASQFLACCCCCCCIIIACCFACGLLLLCSCSCYSCRYCCCCCCLTRNNSRSKAAAGLYQSSRQLMIQHMPTSCMTIECPGPYGLLRLVCTQFCPNGLDLKH